MDQVQPNPAPYFFNEALNSRSFSMLQSLSLSSKTFYQSLSLHGRIFKASHHHTLPQAMVSLLLYHPKLSISYSKFYLFFYLLSTLALSTKTTWPKLKLPPSPTFVATIDSGCTSSNTSDPNSLTPFLSLLDLSDLNEWSFLAPPQKTLATTTIRVVSQLRILTFSLSLNSNQKLLSQTHNLRLPTFYLLPRRAP